MLVEVIIADVETSNSILLHIIEEILIDNVFVIDMLAVINKRC